MSNKYLALTLGPIYQTLLKPRRTREAWAASYVFSWIMKEIVQRLLHPKAGPVIVAREDFILPFFSAENGTFAEKSGVGIWPDRLIVRAKGGEFEQLKRIVREVIEELARQTHEEFVRPDKARYLEREFGFVAPPDPGEIESHFQHYFRAAFLEVEEKDLPAEGDSFVKQINFLLDHLELSAPLAALEPDYVTYLLRAVHRSFLIQNAFHSRWNFESLIEVATSDLRLVDANRYTAIVEADFEQRDRKGRGEEQDLLDRLAEVPDFKKVLSTYHRYIAIVHADGDQIGKLLGKLGADAAAVQAFSLDLFEFGKAANRILAGDRHTAKPASYGYGAAPLYLGGDDLVFFAPVARRDPRTDRLETIFHLLSQLDQAFQQIFQKYAALDVRPTLSYGVSISYYKYPLQEALQVSRKLLAAVKQDKPEFETRNRIHFRLLKHSGQHFGGILDKNGKLLYPLWFEVLNANLKTLNRKKQPTAAVLAGVAHKLDLIEPMIRAVIARDVAREAAASEGQKVGDYASLLHPLFFNQFDEAVHRTGKKGEELHPFLIHVMEFIGASRLQTGTPDLDLTYALLRFIHFLNSREDA